MEYLRAQCERCYKDKDETSEVQAERIQEQRRRGDGLAAWSGRKVDITVDSVLRAREKMREVPMESVHEITHWFEKRFRGECRAPVTRTILRLVSLKKFDAKLEKGRRGFRTNALMSVLFE